MKIFDNKRGTMENNFDVIGQIFALVLIVIFVVIIIDKFNTNIQSMPGATDAAKDAISKMDSKVPAAWNWGILLVYLILFAITLLAAAKSPQNPIFIVVIIFFMIFLVFASMIITNVYDEMKIKSTDFKSAAEEMNISDFLLKNLVYFILGQTLIVGIVVLARKE